MTDEGVAGDQQPEEDANEPISLASLILGILGLFLGIVIIYGPRGIVLALGLVAIILAGTGLRRAETSEQRGTAWGGLVLGTITVGLGILVVSTG